MLKTDSVKCNVHPNYTGKRAPRTDCFKCLMFHIEKVIDKAQETIKYNGGLPTS